MALGPWSGAGRKLQTVTEPGLVAALLGLVEPEERGASCSPLRWTTKSTRALAEEAFSAGFSVFSVCRLACAVPIGYELTYENQSIPA